MTQHEARGDAPPHPRTARGTGAQRHADPSDRVLAASEAGEPSRPATPRDLGMATAEYAITTLAACGFAGLLLVLLRGGEVRGLLLGLVRRALSVD